MSAAERNPFARKSPAVRVLPKRKMEPLIDAEEPPPFLTDVDQVECDGGCGLSRSVVDARMLGWREYPGDQEWLCRDCQ